MTSDPTSGAGPDAPFSHQPSWAEAPSDSLQYELFFAGKFLSIRALKFPSCQFISAWMFDGGVADLFSTYEPLVPSPGGARGLHAHNDLISFELGPGGGRIKVAPPDHGSFEIGLRETVSTVWRVPLGDIVIHQPHLDAKVTHGTETWTGTGYAKRYTFELETQHTYWRFITGPAGDGQNPCWLWTAEAAFDLKKYDYFKLARQDGSIETAAQPGSWHRDRMAHGVLNGVAHQVEIEDLGRIDRVINGPGTNLKLSQGFCRMTVAAGGDVHQSYALNEIACGSHS